MKPLGMTAGFTIVHPNRTQDRIWDTVEEAINAGWTVEQFRAEAAECWVEALRQRAKSDSDAWNR